MVPIVDLLASNYINYPIWHLSPGKRFQDLHATTARLHYYFVHSPCSLKALVDHPNVLATPHLGASTAEAQLKVAQEVAQQFVAACKGEGLMGVVRSCWCCHGNKPHPLLYECR